MVQNLNVYTTALTSYRIIRTYINRIDKSDVLDPAIPSYYLTIVDIYYRTHPERVKESRFMMCTFPLSVPRYSHLDLNAKHKIQQFRSRKKVVFHFVLVPNLHGT
jgi:hypothetical protein